MEDGGSKDRRYNLSGRVWLCVALSLTAATAIALILQPSLWSIILAALLLACPVAAIRAYFMGQRPLPFPVGTIPVTRGRTLNWIAPWYDIVCSVLGLGTRFRDRTLLAARLQAGDHVLDVGCGTGILTQRAAHIVGPSGSACGIDPAPDMIRLARQEAATRRNIARFQVAAIESLPFETESFDVALVSLVMHHLPPDLKIAGMGEVYRVLKPGGRLVVVEIDQPSHWFWRIAFWPVGFHPSMRDHLRGRTANILGEVGFDSVTAIGRWIGLLTFWTAQKAH